MEAGDIFHHVVSAYKEWNNKLTFQKVACYASIGAVGYTVYCFAIKPFLSPLRKIPGPSYNPIFGNVREAMVGESMNSSVKWVKEYGGIVRFYMLFGYERVLIADPKALKEIFVTNVDDYGRLPSTSPLIGGGILTATGSNHRMQRRLMNPFFNHHHVQEYLRIFETKSSELFDKWLNELHGKDECMLSVEDDLMRMTLDAIGESVFSYSFNSLHDKDSQVNRAFRIVTSPQPISFTRFIPFYRKLPTKSNIEFKKNLELVNSIVYRIIRQKRQLYQDDEESSFAGSDFLGKLISVRDEETGAGFTDTELRDQVVTLLLAGHETTGTTMSWILLVLAQHPEIQERLRQEVMSHYPTSGPLKWEHIDQMTYLNAVIKEVQRLYPAVPSFFRRTTRDVTVNGYRLPKGTNVVYHVGAMMRNPNIWTDPEVFNPDRFLQNNDIDLYTHLPFIAGPHKCLGHQFAKMQMRFVIAKLVKEFRFQVPENVKFRRKLRTTLKADPPVRLVVSKV